MAPQALSVRTLSPRQPRDPEAPLEDQRSFRFPEVLGEQDEHQDKLKNIADIDHFQDHDFPKDLPPWGFAQKGADEALFRSTHPFLRQTAPEGGRPPTPSTPGRLIRSLSGDDEASAEFKKNLQRQREEDSPSQFARSALRAHDLPQFLFPVKSAVEFSISADNKMRMVLDHPVEVVLDGHHISFHRVITADISFGKLRHIKGVSLKKLLLWLPVDSISLRYHEGASGHSFERAVHFHAGPVNLDIPSVCFLESLDEGSTKVPHHGRVRHHHHKNHLSCDDVVSYGENKWGVH